MATVSAPAPLKLGEGVGLSPPSIPPTLTVTSSFEAHEAHDPELCPLEGASEHKGVVALGGGSASLPQSWRAALQRWAKRPVHVLQGNSPNRTCHAPKAWALY